MPEPVVLVVKFARTVVLLVLVVSPKPSISIWAQAPFGALLAGPVAIVGAPAQAVDVSSFEPQKQLPMPSVAAAFWATAFWQSDAKMQLRVSRQACVSVSEALLPPPTVPDKSPHSWPTSKFLSSSMQPALKRHS